MLNKKPGDVFFQLEGTTAYRVVFSNDNSKVAFGHGTTEVRVYNTETGSMLHQFTQPTSWCSGLAFSKDGSMLAAVTASNILHIWLLSNGTQIHSINIGGRGPVRFSPNGENILVGTIGNLARVYRIADGIEVSRYTHGGNVNAIDWSIDGTKIVSGSSDNSVCVWNPETGEEIVRMFHSNDVNDVKFTSDGTKVLSGSLDSTTRIWDATTGQELRRQSHTAAITTVDISKDGTRAVYGSLDNTTRVWDTTTSLEMNSFSNRTTIQSVCFSYDGNYVVSGTTNDTTLVDIRTGNIVFDTNRYRGCHGVAISPNMKFVGITGTRGFYCVYSGLFLSANTIMATDIDYESMTLRGVVHSPGPFSAADVHFEYTTDSHFEDGIQTSNTVEVDLSNFNYGVYKENTGVNKSLWTPDGTKIVNQSGVWVSAWDTTTTHKGNHKLFEKNMSTRDIDVSPDSTKVVVATGGNAANILDINTGLQILAFTGHTGSTVDLVRFSPDGTKVASKGNDNRVRVWDSITGDEIVNLSYSSVQTIEFSPNSRYLGIGSSSSCILYDFQEIEISLNAGMSFSIHEIKFSPDGRTMMARSDSDNSNNNTTFIVFNVLTKNTIWSRWGSRIPSSCFAFSKDGAMIAIGDSYRNWIQIHNAFTGQVIRQIPLSTSPRSIDFSNDNKCIAYGLNDGRLYVTEIEGQDVYTYQNEISVNNVSYSPDGTKLLSASNDRTVKVHNTPEGIHGFHIPIENLPYGTEFFYRAIVTGKENIE